MKALNFKTRKDTDLNWWIKALDHSFHTYEIHTSLLWITIVSIDIVRKTKRTTYFGRFSQRWLCSVEG